MLHKRKSYTPRNAAQTEQGNVRSNSTLVKKLLPTLRALQVYGLLPISINPENPKNDVNKKQPRSCIVDNLLMFYSVGLLILNFWILSKGLKIIEVHQTLLKLHFLHAMVVIPVVTCTKPIICGMQIFIFSTSKAKHRNLLSQLNNVGKSFSEHFGPFQGQICRFNIKIFLAIFLTFAPLVGYTIVQHIMLKQSWTAEACLSFFLFPTLTTWNVLPLIFFNEIHRLVRFWIGQVKSSIRQNFGQQTTGKNSLKFYFERFMELSDLQMSIGELLNPYIAFSLLWSMFVVCFTIYFAVNATESFGDPPIPLGPEDMITWTRLIRFNIGWLCLQTFFALLHLNIILGSGRLTNEETRSILNTLLEGMKNYDPDENDHVYFSTMIMSYTMILIKFRPPKSGEGSALIAAAQTGEAEQAEAGGGHIDV